MCCLKCPRQALKKIFSPAGSWKVTRKILLAPGAAPEARIFGYVAMQKTVRKHNIAHALGHF